MSWDCEWSGIMNNRFLLLLAFLRIGAIWLQVAYPLYPSRCYLMDSLMGCLKQVMGLAKETPYLFILGLEDLSYMHFSAMEKGLLDGIKVARLTSSLSHLLFADDHLMFGRANFSHVYCVLDILKEFQTISVIVWIIVNVLTYFLPLFLPHLKEYSNVDWRWLLFHWGLLIWGQLSGMVKRNRLIFNFYYLLSALKFEDGSLLYYRE